MSRKLGSKLETTDTDVELIAGEPDKPVGLSDGAARQWERLVDEMRRSGIVLIPAYRAAIVQASTIMADLTVAWEDIKENGRYVVSKTGITKLSPAVEDTAKLNEKLSKCLWQLGLTPRSRGNSTPKPKSDDLTLEDILAGREEHAEEHAEELDAD